jgi:hypothetical protein
VNNTLAGPLKGVREFVLVIEELDKDARACGVDRDMLEALVRIQTSNSRIRFVNNYGGGNILYLNVNILDVGKACAYSVSLSHQKWVDAEKALATFWSVDNLGFYPKNDVRDRLIKSVEIYSKEFLGEWLKDN